MNIVFDDPQLAINGGPRAVPDGPPSWPCDDDRVRAALNRAYQDGSWGRYEGPHCGQLIDMLRQMHDVEHALLCCSGTFAVELALRGLQVGPGDEVVLAGYDFSGNFRCIESVGAWPVLVDIDPETWCLDANLLSQAVGEQTRAVVVSHLHGGVADMRCICDVAERHGLVIVEDACQAPGAIVQGKPAGTWGDVGVLSFGGSKLLTAGRGGAIVTRHADVAQRAKVYCERGNNAYPLSELQAAVLAPQVDVLADRNRVRSRRVEQLRQLVRSVDGLKMITSADATTSPVYFKVAFQCQSNVRDQFIAAIQAEGIAMDAGFRGFLRRSEKRCRKVGDLHSAENAAQNTLVLHHPVLLESSETIDRLADGVEKVTRAMINT